MQCEHEMSECMELSIVNPDMFVPDHLTAKVKGCTGHKGRAKVKAILLGVKLLCIAHSHNKLPIASFSADQSPAVLIMVSIYLVHVRI